MHFLWSSVNITRLSLLPKIVVHLQYTIRVGRLIMIELKKLNFQSSASKLQSVMKINKACTFVRNTMLKREEGRHLSVTWISNSFLQGIFRQFIIQVSVERKMQQMPSLYGKVNCTSNFHLLLHLLAIVDTAERYENKPLPERGVLQSDSCWFPPWVEGSDIPDHGEISMGCSNNSSLLYDEKVFELWRNRLARSRVAETGSVTCRPWGKQTKHTHTAISF